MKNTLSFAVIGASGNVGRIVVTELLRRHLCDENSLTLYASAQSTGKQLEVGMSSFCILDAASADFSAHDICIFNTEADVSASLVKKALAAGAFVIDSSSHFRLDPSVPLIVPPVNAHLIVKEQRLYAHANCLTSPISTVMAPLHKRFCVAHANATTYQSTSGAGKKALDECWAETQSFVRNTPYKRSFFQRQIAFNVIPQVGSVRHDGLSSEEYKIINEVKKVVDPRIRISATSVRVPVLIGHSVALSLEFESSFSIDDIYETLRTAKNVRCDEESFHTPVEVVGSDDVFVGRIRKDHSVSHGLQMWLCSDNLRRGAAVDAVEIAEGLISLEESLQL